MGQVTSKMLAEGTNADMQGASRNPANLNHAGSVLRTSEPQPWNSLSQIGLPGSSMRMCIRRLPIYYESECLCMHVVWPCFVLRVVGMWSSWWLQCCKCYVAASRIGRCWALPASMLVKAESCVLETPSAKLDSALLARHWARVGRNRVWTKLEGNGARLARQAP